MCTSDTPCSAHLKREAGITLLELLVGMALTLVLAGALAPAWLGLQAAEVAAGDRAVVLVQSRVVVARLERDLRLAGGGGGLAGAGGLVEADATHLVLLTAGLDGTGSELVEWEVVGTVLMRRRAPAVVAPRLPVSHGMFTDNKTMLEGVASRALFTYWSGGRALVVPLTASDLQQVEVVCAQSSLAAAGGRAGNSLHFTVEAEVGR
jgi:hypothetical protein